MQLQDYYPLAIRTAKQMQTPALDLWHANIGMLTELGELADAYKRRDIYGRALDTVNVLEELGDFMWYLNLHSHVMGLPLFGHTMPAPTPLAYPEGLGEEHQLLALLQAASTSVALQPWVGAADTPEDVAEQLVQMYPVMVFMVARLAEMSNGSLAQVLDRNIGKLAARYGDQYSDYNALHRDTSKERRVLAGVPNGAASS